MKNGTMYASRVKKLFGKLRQSHPQPVIGEADDPMRQLAIAILGMTTSEEEGAQAVDQLLSHLVDWNEVRVSRPFELCRAIGEDAGALVQRCQQLITALNSVYRQENKPSLERLKNLGRREARQQLEKLAGFDEYAVASVFLWTLGGHAIPVNDALLAALRHAELVDPSASREDVQAFLERNISAVEAKEFCVLMSSFVADQRSMPSRSRAAAGR